jgi:imidazolonepropionase-like amidohydrolase
VRTPDYAVDPFFTRSVPASIIKTFTSPEYQRKVAADPNINQYPVVSEIEKKNLKVLADAGVRYGMGTDTGVPGRFHGYFEHVEMELMVQAGLTPMQVLVAATRSGAEFLKARDLGTLEPSKWADLIVLSRNPLSDIRNTRSIESVYIAGNKVR